jgi:mRNA interferase RelE/StbE
MDRYAVTLTRAARKDTGRLDRTIAKRVFAAIESLSANPRPPGVRKLHNEQYLWRIRVGDFRVIYAIYDHKAAVDVMLVRHRREAYRRI